MLPIGNTICGQFHTTNSLEKSDADVLAAPFYNGVRDSAQSLCVLAAARLLLSNQNRRISSRYPIPKVMKEPCLKTTYSLDESELD